jgi:hypothetical protein
MTLRRTILFAFAFAVVATTDLLAQVTSTGKRPCDDELMSLREEVSKRANDVRGPQQHIWSVIERCRLMAGISEAEANMIKYAEDNATWCGIPANEIRAMKAVRTWNQKLHDSFCDTAADPIPTLSRRVHDPSTPRPPKPVQPIRRRIAAFSPDFERCSGGSFVGNDSEGN